MTFEKLGLKPEILKSVTFKGYSVATPIQEKSIPAILEGKDVMGGAQTGTGKTAAFALPILNNLSNHPALSKHPRALVLTPTRELADQVGESFSDYGKFLKLKPVKVYGGVNIKPQIKQLRNSTDIVIATPGRLLDLLNQNHICLSQIEILVLDEADRMLDMGFIRDIKKILSFLPEKRQNLLFSATYGKDIKALAAGILRNPVSVEVAARNTAAEKVEQKLHYIEKGQKRHLLAHLVKEESWYQVLVFVKTKHGANRLSTQLLKSGIPSSSIHGDKSQGARTRALNDFKAGKLQALVATDVAARGIDMENLTHVVNYDLPQTPEDYVHRIGRTGRAGKSGIAISFVSHEEKKQLMQIERLLKKSITVEKVQDFKPVYQTAEKTAHSQTHHKPKKFKSNIKSDPFSYQGSHSQKRRRPSA
ncbi:MAG: DEAD/DEAH box helicase [Spirochaetaceae bacterium]|nr:DEAD/DEAH box helicase [Spirochaetaceae bacterium]